MYGPSLTEPDLDISFYASTNLVVNLAANPFSKSKFRIFLLILLLLDFDFFYLFSSLVLFPSWIGFFTGDIVGCYLNIEDEKVIFSLNGDSLPPFNHLFKTAKYVSQHGYNVLWKLMKC